MRGRSCSSSYLMYDHQPPEWKMSRPFLLERQRLSAVGADASRVRMSAARRRREGDQERERDRGVGHRFACLR